MVEIVVAPKPPGALVHEGRVCRYPASDASQGYTVPIPLFSILSNVILAHADDILPDLLLLLPHLFDKG